MQQTPRHPSAMHVQPDRGHEQGVWARRQEHQPQHHGHTAVRWLGGATVDRAGRAGPHPSTLGYPLLTLVVRPARCALPHGVLQYRVSTAPDANWCWVARHARDSHLVTARSLVPQGIPKQTNRCDTTTVMKPSFFRPGRLNRARPLRDVLNDGRTRWRLDSPRYCLQTSHDGSC